MRRLTPALLACVVLFSTAGSSQASPAGPRDTPPARAGEARFQRRVASSSDRVPRAAGQSSVAPLSAARASAAPSPAARVSAAPSPAARASAARASAAPSPAARASAAPSPAASALAILDSEGRTLVLRGINVGEKSAPYLPAVTEEDFARIASWGLDSIRFLILWAAIEPEEGLYDDSYFDLVEPCLDMAGKYGLHVILDMHQDVYGEMFNHDGAPYWACPEQMVGDFHNLPHWWMDYFTPQVMTCFSWFWSNQGIQDHLIEAWRRAAARLGNHPAVIGFDLFNEPYPGFNMTPRFEPDQLQPFYERLIPALQLEAPEAYVFFEPWVLRDYFLPTFLEPMAFVRLVYFPHYYNMDMELTGAYVGRGPSVTAWAKWIQQEADELGVPFVVGEYGGAVYGDGIAELLTDVNEALEGQNTGGMYWEYRPGDGYSPLNADRTERSWIVEALVRSYPRSVAGALTNFDFQPDVARLDVHWVRDASISAATEIAAPSRLYPSGVQIALSNPDEMSATYDPARGVVTITDHGPDGAARAVTLLPE